jgi:hypothetical protein
MAKVAKREGVTVWMEIDGKKVGVSPEISSTQKQTHYERQPEGFASLAQWEAWKDLEHARAKLAAIERKRDEERNETAAS